MIGTTDERESRKSMPAARLEDDEDDDDKLGLARHTVFGLL